MDNSIPKVSDGSAPALRDKIVRFEAALLDLPQVEIPLAHYFGGGLYLREGRVAAGTVFTGKIHKSEHFCILAEGEVTVADANGEAQRFVGPCVIHAMPGAKRAVVCHSDIVWINCHANPTDERDLEKIESALVTEDFDDPELLAVLNRIGALPCS